MSHWLYPANTKYFDVFEAFKSSTVYWPISSKVAVGDIIYFYLALPYKQIAYRTEVLAINV